MYQSKPSLSPGESSSSSTCSNCTALPVIARVAWTRCALDSGTSQSGRVVGTSAHSWRSHVSCWVRDEGPWQTYPVEQIKNDAHGDAKLLKVQVAIAVDVGEVPDAGELVIPQAAVLEHWRGLLAREELAAISACGEDVPVCLDLLRLDPWGSHGGCLGECWVLRGSGSGSTGGSRSGSSSSRGQLMSRSGKRIWIVGLLELSGCGFGVVGQGGGLVRRCWW